MYFKTLSQSVCPFWPILLFYIFLAIGHCSIFQAAFPHSATFSCGFRVWAESTFLKYAFKGKQIMSSAAHNCN